MQNIKVAKARMQNEQGCKMVLASKRARGLYTYILHPCSLLILQNICHVVVVGGKDARMHI
jgi:hypothetical protein